MSFDKTHLVRIVKFFIVFSPLVAYWSFQPTLVKISGLSMGTSYTIKAYASKWVSTSDLQKDIDDRLIAINKSMSTWDKDSEISKFNNFKSLDKFAISQDFYNVLTQSIYIHKITNGSWDGTIEPILKLWGFVGYKKKEDIKVPKQQIDEMRPYIGFDKVKLSLPHYVQKTNKNTLINLSSIAKGYAVDEVSNLLDKKGIESYFVEIGGEIFAKSKKHNGKKWKIGISSPSPNDIEKEIFHIVKLDNQAIATSGDYRNFITLNNKNFSHIINPKTLMPIDSNITSVSVLAPTTMLADALATAFMVMDIKESIKLCEEMDGVEAFIIIKNEDNIFSTVESSGFKVNSRF